MADIDMAKVFFAFSVAVLFIVCLAFIGHALDRFFELVRIAERIEKMLRGKHG